MSHADCPGRAILDHVTGRWGLLVLIAPRPGPLRFFEPRDRVEGVSEKTLAQSLRTLTRDGLLARTVAPSAPPRVSYALTGLGRELTAPLRRLVTVIGTNAAEVVAAQEAYDA